MSALLTKICEFFFLSFFVSPPAVPFGGWFQNVLYWWNKRNHPNVLFLTYEGMKKVCTHNVRYIVCTDVCC